MAYEDARIRCMLNWEQCGLAGRGDALCFVDATILKRYIDFDLEYK